MSHYTNQKPISDHKWMESLLGQISLRVNEGVGEEILDAKLRFHDKLKEVLADTAYAFQPDDHVGMQNFLNQLSIMLAKLAPKTSAQARSKIVGLYKEISASAKQSQQDPENPYNHPVVPKGQLPPLPPGYE